MKNYFFVIFIFLATFHSCKENPKTVEGEFEISEINNDLQQESIEESIAEMDHSKVDNSIYYTQQDSVVIETKHEYMVFSRKSFNEIVDKHPEFFLDEVVDPKTSLYQLSKELYSELGGDQYFSVYAYFLRKRYDFKAYEEEQEKLRRIYYNLLDFGSFISGGGTYYTHEKGRLTGYVEYDTYLLSIEGKSSDEANFEEQKKAHMNYLKDAVKRGRKNEFGRGDLFENEAEIDAFEARLFRILDTVDKEITNKFYLEKAKQFYDPKGFRWYQDN